MAENKNTFQTTVESLMKGMDGFVSSKTVVGEPIQVGETIILPLVDVSFGMGAGAFCGEKKKNSGGGIGGQDVSELRSGDPEWKYPSGQCEKSGWYFKASGYDSGFCR